VEDLKSLYDETRALGKGLSSLVDPLIDAVNQIGTTLNTIEDKLELIAMKIEQQATDEHVDLHPVDLAMPQDTSITIGIAPRDVQL
jgi:hypothetical protein